MYVLPIIVPAFLDGPRILLQTDWKRALVLLRDSLGARYGPIRVVCPYWPAESPEGAVQRLEALEPDGDIEVRAAIAAGGRARDYWLLERRPWGAAVAEEMERAQVVHTGLDDLFRPLMGTAFRMAVKRGLPTVFVQDTDVVVQAPELAGSGAISKLRARAYVACFERVCRACVARADLTLMKGGSLVRRYQPFAKNLCEFEDTSYTSSEIVSAVDVERRVEGFRVRRDLRLVYCGRLVARKGVHLSLEIVARARALGADVRLDVFGAGPERERLEAQARQLGLLGPVQFRGSLAYGPTLFGHLSQADALLFTPTSEDTPRMIFDGYAAGLPLVASAIPYVEERARREGAAVLLPRNDLEGAAAVLARLAMDRTWIGPLTQRAHQAAAYHAADAWYARRAEWIHEAVGRARYEAATRR